MVSRMLSCGSRCRLLADVELGNKCGKCQNHEIEVSKKGHARDCPFKKCNCLKCRLLDARSDILQVISGKETKLKGTKKDPNCGFCQNHGIKILRKGHVRSCGFGQERHFKLDNCFDCEVHYIRNEVNRLQIKMRRAMKEDRTLSEEQRKTAREAITRDEVEKVCDMARLARKKRESILTQQTGESSSQQHRQSMQTSRRSSPVALPSAIQASGVPSHANGQSHRVQNLAARHFTHQHLPPPLPPPPYPHQHQAGLNVASNSNINGGANSNGIYQPTPSEHTHHLANQLARQTDVWRPWSQHQVAAAIAAQQQQNQHHHQHLPDLAQAQAGRQNNHLIILNNNNSAIGRQVTANCGSIASSEPLTANSVALQQTAIGGCNGGQQQQQDHLQSAITSMAAAANQSYLINSLQAAQQHQQRFMLDHQHRHPNDPHHQQQQQQLDEQLQIQMQLQQKQQQQQQQNHLNNHVAHQQLSPPSSPAAQSASNSSSSPDQPLPLIQRNLQEQQLFNTLFRLIVAQFAQPNQTR